MCTADKASVFTRFVYTDAPRLALLTRVPSSSYVATIQRRKERNQSEELLSMLFTLKSLFKFNICTDRVNINGETDVL